MRMTATKSLRFILYLWSMYKQQKTAKKGSCLFSYFAPIEWEVMVTLGGGLQAVESLPGGVPTYSLCISLPIFLYFSSHFGEGINLAEKHFVSYLYDKKMTLFLKLIFLHIKLYLVVLYNTYQIFIFIHVVLHWWFLSEDNRMIVVGWALQEGRNGPWERSEGQISHF